MVLGDRGGGVKKKRRGKIGILRGLEEKMKAF